VNAINEVHWNAFLEHEVLGREMHCWVVEYQRLPRDSRELWNRHPDLEQVIGSRVIGRDATEDIHAAVGGDASIVEEKRSSQCGLSEERPLERLQRKFPQVIERSALVVASSDEHTSLFLIVNVFHSVLHQRVTLSWLWISVNHVSVRQRRYLVPLFTHQIEHGKVLQVKHRVGRSSPENVNKSVVDRNLVSISSNGLVGVDFRPAFSEKFPLSGFEIQSEARKQRVNGLIASTGGFLLPVNVRCVIESLSASDRVHVVVLADYRHSVLARWMIVLVVECLEALYSICKVRLKHDESHFV
jgi:hypothetical protein